MASWIRPDCALMAAWDSARHSGGPSSSVRSQLEVGRPLRPMILHFDCFRFDGPNRQLLGDAGAIRLNPKAFDVLLALIERAGEFVSKDELLDRVWPGTHVADGVLKVCVAEIRRALGDSPTAPRFIETVHRRGYRFVATTTVVHADETRPARVDAAPLRTRSLLAWPPSSAVDRPAALVGRGAGSSTCLAERLGRALDGERQVVVRHGRARRGQDGARRVFRRARRARPEPSRSRAASVSSSSARRKPYMPVLDAIGRLVRADGTVSAPLRRYAPTWFAQLPWLIEEHDRERLGRELLGATRERMLREMAEFVEALTREIPLVLVIEDLHWCDPSTVDLLSLIAVRREPARPPRARHLPSRGAHPRVSPVARGRATIGGGSALHRDRPRRAPGRSGSGVPAATLRAEPVPSRRGSAASRAHRWQPALPGDPRRSSGFARRDRRSVISNGR